MDSAIDTEFNYQGITFDERLAIRQLFINEDGYPTMEQPYGRLLPEGSPQ